MNAPTLRNFIAYFLRLGALGFGGPVALANAMRRDLVEQRGWLSEEEYENGLALAAACPGPLAYQLGVYCGYVRFGVTGGLAVAVAFGLPPFLLVSLAAFFYVRFEGNWEVRALFYGIAPAVVALITKACWNLGKRTLRRDALAWLFAVTACAITVILKREIAILFIGSGLLGSLVFGRGPAPPTAPPSRPADGEPVPRAVMLAAIPGAGAGATAKLFLFFFKTGLLVFGSGLVIVPFLKTQVVDQYHWLSDRQFLDAVAIGMISPGPVVIMATFAGFLINGFSGAITATLGIFAAPVLITVVATPLLLRVHRHPRVAGFIRGIGVTVVGVLVGTAYLVAREAIGDWVTAAIAAAVLAIVIRWNRLPEPWLIAACGVIGLLAYPLLQPTWLMR